MIATDKMTETQKCIISQLSENTGIAMSDSGGTDGRHWQQWAKTNNIDWNEGLIIDQYSITIPVHVYMNNCLERNEAAVNLENDIIAYLNTLDPENVDPVLCYNNEGEITEFLENIGAIPTCYGGMNFQNTYNGESNLSQVLQMFMFEFGGKDFVIIETHNGADVRGGYSTGRLYEIKEHRLDDFVDITVRASTESEDEVLYKDQVWDEEKECYIHTETGEPIDFYNSACN